MRTKCDLVVVGNAQSFSGLFWEVRHNRQFVTETLLKTLNEVQKGGAR